MKFSTRGLALAGMDLVPPFEVDVRLDPDEDLGTDLATEGTAPLNVQRVARVLPGRRFSAIGEFQGQRVFAKVFYGRDARTYWQRECQGAEYMARAGVPSAALIASGATGDEAGYVVFYSVLPGAIGLDEHDASHLRNAVRILATLHNADLVQSDVHLDNFVVAGGAVHAVDADGLRPTHQVREQLANLGALLAQRSPDHDGDVERLWSEYASVRGDPVAGLSSAAALVDITREQRRHRVRRYLKKTQRECSEFVHRHNLRHDFLCDRAHWQRLQRFMVFAPMYFGEGTPLKLGNSATVVRAEIEGHDYVIKRYNIKGPLHRLRRWFKRRARHAWINGHWLAFLGIDTARPVALLEQRLGWFTGVSYLVMPDCGSVSLARALEDSPQAFDRLAPKALAILRKLRAAGLQHNDLKATNFVYSEVDPNEDLVLIDYDAVTAGAPDRDRARFLANWEDTPELHARWTRALEEAGL